MTLFSRECGILFAIVEKSPILPLRSARKMKKKVGRRFFASFECASISVCLLTGYKDSCESVQFFLWQSQTYRELLPCNSYAFTR